MCDLDRTSVRSFVGFGCEFLFRGPLYLDFRLFFLGGTGGEEKAPSHGQQGRSLDDEYFQTSPFCYVLYVEQWGFRYIMSSGHLEGGPRSSNVLTERTMLDFDNPST
jgi:hypothetical protein